MLCQADATLWCVSSWHDNGFEKLVSAAEVPTPHWSTPHS
jgi:hypothetical protein